MRQRYCVLVAAVLALAAARADASGSVTVEALLPGMAVLVIDGQRRTLREGNSVAGVLLVSADAREAVLEIAGERHTVGVSARISTQYEAPARQQVDIPRNQAMQYLTTATINGRRVQVLVDTGANIVALNASHAAALGLDYASGEQISVETAGSTVPGYVVQLQSVDIGGIRIDNVRATVILGAYPRSILLGMSFLQHVDFQERNGVLSLSREW